MRKHYLKPPTVGLVNYQPAKKKRRNRKGPKAFYFSQVWRELRYQVLREQGGRCQCCGRTAAQGIMLHVDHIVPIARDPSLKLEKSNLQILCEDCNIGKGATDTIRWAP